MAREGLNILPSPEARLGRLMAKRRKTSKRAYLKKRAELDAMKDRISRWLQRLCQALDVELDEQQQAVQPGRRLSGRKK